MYASYTTREAFMRNVMNHQNLTHYPKVLELIRKSEQLFRDIQQMESVMPLQAEERLFIEAIRDLNYQASRMQQAEQREESEERSEQQQENDNNNKEQQTNEAKNNNENVNMSSKSTDSNSVNAKKEKNDHIQTTSPRDSNKTNNNNINNKHSQESIETSTAANAVPLSASDALEHATTIAVQANIRLQGGDKQQDSQELNSFLHFIEQQKQHYLVSSEEKEIQQLIHNVNNEHNNNNNNKRCSSTDKVNNDLNNISDIAHKRHKS